MSDSRGEAKARLLRELHESVSSGSLARFESALARGADPLAATSRGIKALTLAARCWGPGQGPQPERARILKRLIALGADLFDDASGGMTALEWALRSGNREGALMLIEAGSPAGRGPERASSDCFDTPLTALLAGCGDWAEGVEALLRAGADPRQKSGRGYDWTLYRGMRPRACAALEALAQRAELLGATREASTGAGAACSRSL